MKRAGEKRRYRLLPRLMTERERDVWLTTLAWSAHPFRGSVEFFVELAPGLAHEARVPDIFDPNLAQHLANAPIRFDVEKARGAAILAWCHDTPVPLGADSVTVVAPRHTMHHTFVLQRRLLSDLEAWPEPSARALLDLKSRGHSRAFLFGSGPSLAVLSEQLDEGQLRSGYRMICNGVVLNREATARVLPDVAIALDPLYHAGVSFYSGRFLEEMRRLMELYGTLLVTRREFVPWLATRLPAERIVGLEIQEGIDFRFDLDAKPVLANLNGNVLAAGMLPVGASLAEELVLLGFDGRDPSLSSETPGNRFAWSHDTKSSIDGSETRIREVNPKVFDRDYDEYHRRHDQTLGSVLSRLRVSHKRVFRLNDPFIPALAELPRWRAERARGVV